MSLRSSPDPSRRWTTGSVAGAIPRFFAFVGCVHFMLWLPIWVIFFQERALSLTQIGLLDGIGWLCMAAAEVPTGALADRYGRRISLVVGGVLVGVSMLALLAEVFSPIFLVGWMLWGVAHSFFSGAADAWLYDTLKTDGRATEYPRYAGRLFAVIQASQGVASVIGAWVATFDMTLCFVVPGILGFIGASIAFTLREPPTALGAGATRRYWTDIAQAARIASGQPVVRYLVLIGASTLVFPFLLTFMLLQPYAAGLGIPVWALGPIVLLRGLGAVGGSLLANRVSGWLGSSRVLIGTQAVTVVCMALLAVATTPPIMALFVVTSFASGLLRPVLSGMLNAEIPSEQRATILSLQALLWTLFLAAVEPVLFAVGDQVGLPFAIGASAVVLAVVAATLLALLRGAISSRAAAEGSR
jgi:MFS family permease